MLSRSADTALIPDLSEVEGSDDVGEAIELESKLAFSTAKSKKASSGSSSSNYRKWFQAWCRSLAVTSQRPSSFAYLLQLPTSARHALVDLLSLAATMYTYSVLGNHPCHDKWPYADAAEYTEPLFQLISPHHQLWLIADVVKVLTDPERYVHLHHAWQRCDSSAGHTAPMKQL